MTALDEMQITDQLVAAGHSPEFAKHFLSWQIRRLHAVGKQMRSIMAAMGVR